MLARGGMAEVFLARMSGVGGFAKLLVIKRILPHLNDDPEFHEMFLNEGRVAARLNHPNVCQVYELGEVDGKVFLAMEYLEGLAWAELAPSLPRGRGVELRIAASVIGPICEGLRYAHEFTDVDGTPMSIVHRDVSPQNLFITTEGVCKLLDFGVSKVLTEGSRTRTGMLKGKLPYMAPEQIRGEQIDARADVFSMGVVLWESLTGRRLFQRDSDYQIWKAITEEDVPRVTSQVAGLPPQIDQVVARALERDAAQRYPTIRAFAADLRDAAARAGGTFDTATLGGILKSLGAVKLADKIGKVSRAIGRPSRMSAPPPLPAAITQELEAIEQSDTHSVQLRDASVKLRRRPRASKVAIAVAALAIVIGIGAGLWWTRDSEPVAAHSEDAHAMVAVATVDAASSEPPPHRDEVDPATIPKPEDNGVLPPKPTPPKRDDPPRPRSVRKPTKKPVDPKPAVEAAVAEPGFYSVDSKPYATIFIDDKSYGETPLFKVQLTPGKHRIRAVRADGKSQRLSITIQPGKLFSSGTLTW
jgi:eukaryotic-like serine/threonine-protein kinase